MNEIESTDVDQTEDLPLARVTDEERAEAEQIAEIARMESPEEFEAALRNELAPQTPGVELTDEASQRVADLDVIYANLRAHRDNLAKLKTVAILSKAGVPEMPHLDKVRKDIKGQRMAIDALVELANELHENPEASIPMPSEIEIPRAV